MTWKVENIKQLVIIMITLTGLFPIALYYFCIGNAPLVDAYEAMKQLNTKESSAVLVDVREYKAYNSLHIEGAENWPFEQIRKIRSKKNIPEKYRNRSLFLICNNGIASAFAAKKINKYSTKTAASVQGGTSKWISITDQSDAMAPGRLKTSAGELIPFPFQHTPLVEQWIASITAFGIKPLYMSLCFILLFILRRFKAHDITTLRRGLFFFLAGEIFCAVNYIFFGENSYLVEYLHIFGMVLAFGFTTYAIFEALDTRILNISDPQKKCAAINLCPACIKYKADEPCGFRRMLLIMSSSVAVLCFMPLLSSLVPRSYNTNILGVAYNYIHPVIYQIFEIRIAPIMAILFFISSFWAQWSKRINSQHLPKILFSAGMGFFGFSMFRLVIFSVNRDNLVWFVVWEEVTELVYIFGIYAMFFIFRKRLFNTAP